MDDEAFEEQRMGEIEVGEVQWHCSEEGGGPDVGLLLRLDASQSLWAGEITRADWEDAGEDAVALGENDMGWWAILYEEGGARKTVLGRFIDPEPARQLIEAIAFALKPPALNPQTSP